MKHSSTILVVDDLPIFRDLVAIFHSRTARVVTAANAEQAIAQLRQQRVDLVIADLHMPGTDGDELCRRLKDDPEFEDLPIMIMLRQSNDEDSVRAVRAGADDMLCKPISRMALVEAVNHLLRSPSGRALPRIQIEIPIELRSDLMHTWGTARNISRGGVNVQVDCELEPKSEVVIQLELPDSGFEISPVAEVVWRRDDENQRYSEMGLRFLAIDAATMSNLNAYISEYLAPGAPKSPGSHGTPSPG
jgi:CheY-like chemotaxis protein